MPETAQRHSLGGHAPRLLVPVSLDVQLGDIQVLGLDPFKLVASTWLQGDSISSVATLPSHPYVLIGMLNRCWCCMGVLR